MITSFLATAEWAGTAGTCFCASASLSLALSVSLSLSLSLSVFNFATPVHIIELSLRA